jgi:hypothetical protein
MGTARAKTNCLRKDAADKPLKTPPSGPHLLSNLPLSYRLAKCSIASHCGASEEVADEVDEEVDEEGLLGGLQTVTSTVFRPHTWAVSRCKLEVQLEANSQRAKRYVSGLNLHREVDEKIHGIWW